MRWNLELEKRDFCRLFKEKNKTVCNEIVRQKPFSSQSVKDVEMQEKTASVAAVRGKQSFGGADGRLYPCSPGTT